MHRTDQDFETDNVLPRSEVTTFIELAIGRQVGFWHDAEDPPAMDYDSAVVNSTALPKRCAHDQDRHKPSRGLHDGGQPTHDRIEKRILQQKIFYGISRKAQLGEYRYSN
jgi:hypothetical protein